MDEHFEGSLIIRILDSHAERRGSLETERRVSHQAFPNPNDPVHQRIDASVDRQLQIIQGLSDRLVDQVLGETQTPA